MAWEARLWCRGLALLPLPFGVIHPVPPPPKAACHSADAIVVAAAWLAGVLSPCHTCELQWHFFDRQGDMIDLTQCPNLKCATEQEIVCFMEYICLFIQFVDCTQGLVSGFDPASYS